MSLRTLYLCYFGLREPLVQTQVLPYLRQIAAAGIKVHLLTFEPRMQEEWSESQLTEQRANLATECISWFCLPYHKTFSVPATVYDIMAGARFAVQLARRERLDVLHARAHIAMAMALLAQRFARVKLVFDIRGLMAEEYADALIWPKRSLRFRAVKILERLSIRQADQIVVLTKHLRDWLIAYKLKCAEQIEVIPCCVDFTRFDDSLTTAEEAGGPGVATNRFEVVYTGSLMGLYLVEEMGRFFKAIKAQRPDAFLRILSVSPPEQSVAALESVGLDQHDFQITAVSAADVPLHLRRARLGVSFRKAAFAQIAASPTKIPEYLAAGIPVVCNAGIGDMDQLIQREQVGVVLRGFDDEAYRKVATQALVLAEETETRQRCRRIAREYFDLQTVGGPRYENVYRRLEGNGLAVSTKLVSIGDNTHSH